MKINREVLVQNIESPTKWDVIVIGGGASGLGAALDAVSRGLKTLLLEQYDFTKGTSSRSTKLVHGGVRYLAQGDIALVFEALRERGRLLHNAPHLVHNTSFVVPSYKWWGVPFYTIGLTIYDILAGRLSFGRSLPIGKKGTLKKIPTLISLKLKGSTMYHDGQFDDSRLGINMAQTIIEKGGTALNYFKVTDLIKTHGKITGVEVEDQINHKIYKLRSKVVINATGVFVDAIIRKDMPHTPSIVTPSQGVHLVLDKSFLPTEYALMIPKTSDGRILFMVPWHEHVIMGTTDLPKKSSAIEPLATKEEVDFILETAGRYLTKKPRRSDVKSVFAGLRPLAAAPNEGGKTKEISRSHKIIASESGLITVIGGKWTTYRQMGEDIINKAYEIMGGNRGHSQTTNLCLHGYKKDVDFKDPLYFYGTDKAIVEELVKLEPSLGHYISEKLKIIGAQVVLACRNELAVNIEDVLARRTRALFIDASESIKMAPKVAKIMAKEMDKSEEWITHQIEAYTQLAHRYLLK